MVGKGIAGYDQSNLPQQPHAHRVAELLLLKGWAAAGRVLCLVWLCDPAPGQVGFARAAARA